jgi:lipopolysaccharide assembly protein B
VNLGQFLLLVVILGAILGFIGVPWWMSRKREPQRWDPAQAYLAAIDALVRADRPGALLALRELAQKDPGNLRAYLRLGDLVRRMGYPERAHRIHADLLARQVEGSEDLRRLHESLLDDLRFLDRGEEEQRIAEKLLAIDRRSPIALRALVRYHERRGDWERALESLDEWDRISPGQTHPTPAQLRIHMARTHIDGGRLREARKLLDEAAKMPGDGPIAHVFIGDLLAQEGRTDEACEEWIQYVRDHGYRSDQVLARLERAYFEMGRFGDLIRVYEQLAAGKSGSLHAAVALADMHRRRGRLEEAVRQLESVVEQQPGHRPARRQLIGALLQIGRTEQALRELDVLMGEIGPAAAGVACGVCGAENQDAWVRCERCGAWLPPARPLPPPKARPVPAPAAD